MIYFFLNTTKIFFLTNPEVKTFLFQYLESCCQKNRINYTIINFSEGKSIAISIFDFYELLEV